MQRSDYVEGELSVGERSVELYFAPFSDEESGGVLVVLHDVTEQRKTEERRKEFVANAPTSCAPPSPMSALMPRPFGRRATI